MATNGRRSPKMEDMELQNESKHSQSRLNISSAASTANTIQHVEVEHEGDSDTRRTSLVITDENGVSKAWYGAIGEGQPTAASAPIKKTWKIISSLPPKDCTSSRRLEKARPVSFSSGVSEDDESLNIKGGGQHPLKKERTVSFTGVSDDEDNEVDLNTPSPQESSSKRWNKIQGFVKGGSFLLATQQIEDSKNKGLKSKRIQRRESLTRQHMEEIRAGIEFSSFHCILAILLYLGISVTCYKWVFQPEWSVTDCCYFAVTTFTTVGFGDLHPTNRASMMFTSIYALVGVASLGVALGLLGSHIIDAQERNFSRVERQNKHKLLRIFASSRSDLSDDDAIATIGKKAQNNHPSVAVFLMHCIPLFLLIFALAYLIGRESQWDWAETLYFIVVTGCAVGYGDLVPKSDKSKQIAIAFIPLVCGAMGQLLASAAGRIIEARSSRFRRQLEQKDMTEEDLECMDADGDGRVSKAEFLAFMLVAMKKIDKDLVDELDRYFERLDTVRSGYLSREDLIETARRKLRDDPIQCMQRRIYKQQLLSKSRHTDRTEDSSV